MWTDDAGLLNSRDPEVFARALQHRGPVGVVVLGELPEGPLERRAQDPNWYPGHAVLLAGMVLIAVSLVALARGRTLAVVPRAHAAAVIAAVAAAVGAPGMLLHLAPASDAGAIAAHQSIPITDLQGIAETVTVPAFGLSIAALAVLGAMTRTLGNTVTAVPGILGGVGYGLAGATILFTDRLDFLFPAATGIRRGLSPSGSGSCASERRAWPPAPFSRGACAIGSPSGVMGEARRRPL